MKKYLIKDLPKGPVTIVKEQLLEIPQSVIPIPKPPEIGTFNLQSVNGAISWVAVV